MIRLNEKQEAENLINSFQKINLSDLVLLAKYYKHVGLDVDSSLYNYIVARVPSYNESVFDRYIELAKKNAEDNSLRTNVTIPITQKEIDTLKTITNLKARRICFCIIVVAKYYFLNPAKDGIDIDERMKKKIYLNNTFRDIFKIARASYSREEKEKIIIELVRGGYLELTSTHKYIVNCIDLHGSPVENLCLTPNFVYYIYQLEDANIFKCEKCGDYVRRKNKANNQKYCAICSGNIKREQTKKRVKRHRLL